MAVLSTPAVWLSIHLKPMAVIRTDAAQGAIRAQRVRRRPGNRWLNSWARASESSIVRPTTATVQITVRTRTCPRSVSPKSLRYLSKPAEPRTKPLVLIRRKEVRTIS